MTTEAVPKMSMMQFLSIADPCGRLRCRWCGKFRKMRDFRKQRTGASFCGPRGGGMVDWAMKCKACQKKPAGPLATGAGRA